MDELKVVTRGWGWGLGLGYVQADRGRAQGIYSGVRVKGIYRLAEDELKAPTYHSPVTTDHPTSYYYYSLLTTLLLTILHLTTSPGCLCQEGWSTHFSPLTTAYHPSTDHPTFYLTGGLYQEGRRRDLCFPDAQPHARRPCLPHEGAPRPLPLTLPRPLAPPLTRTPATPSSRRRGAPLTPAPTPSSNPNPIPNPSPNSNPNPQP